LQGERPKQNEQASTTGTNKVPLDPRSIMTGPETAGVDIHGHAIPLQFLKEVSKRGLVGVTAEESNGYVVTFPGGKPLRAIDGIMVDFTDRLEWLDSQRMSEQIVAPWLDIHGQELGVVDGGHWVRALNDAVAEAVSAAGDRLYGYASLHLEDPASAGTELARAVQELGMVGTMIPTHPPTGSLADPSFDALWEAAVALDVPIVLHPPTSAPSKALFADDPQFKGTFGRGIDTTLAAGAMIVAGVFDRFPALKLVLVHGGGFLPFQVGRFDRDFGSGGSTTGLERLPSEYVAALFYDTVLLSEWSLRLLLDMAGSDHVMIGSDYGARPKERGGIGLADSLDAAAADATQHRDVMRGTAERLFLTNNS
jgi:aminocarboxymuconate-semialdehyde decarboxylase